ncbi:hypothetical protein G6F68_009307 [Rhizopus microsporus]|nr:hypothetical protein G6F68_009307 [Rhizopus microsporus]
MSSANDANLAIISALNSIVTQNRYAALQSIRLIYNYDSSMNIELWLRFFEAKADRMGLDDGMKIEQLPSYLPNNIAQWVLSNHTFTKWRPTKKALIETFSIPVAQQKQACRAKLEALRQGNMSSRQFKATFQSIVQELPEGATIPMEVLRSIYLDFDRLYLGLCCRRSDYYGWNP